MTFLGIGPGELLMIIILALVVVGPERLPGMARQAGRMLVTIRNWMQSSPDAALVLRARQEIEQELAQLRTELLEVQSVRDEVMGVAKQIDEAVSPIKSIRAPSVSDLIKPPAEQTVAAGNIGAAGAENASAEDTTLVDSSGSPISSSASSDTPATDAPATATAAVEPAAASADAPAEAPATATTTVEPAAVSADTPAGALVDAAATAVEPTEPAVAAQQSAAPALAAEIEALGLRLQAVMADLHALQEQLKQHGLLAPDWVPPSHTMQLPQPEEALEEASK